jgi:hypothetical protein
MKYFINKPFPRISYALLLCLGVGLLALSSCKEDDPTAPIKSSGPPTIEAIRTTDPADADSTFVRATLGTTIVIVGKNLAATQSIYFNGLQTSINPAYATQTHLIVRIPDNVPTLATAANVSNELRVVNAGGEATYSFEVLPPAPLVEKVDNEFAQAGTKITLMGKYFYFVKQVIFPGDIKTTEFTAKPDGTSLTVTVPAGVNMSDPLHKDLVVESQSGFSTINKKIKFNDDIGIVTDFDTKTTGGYWSNTAATAPTIKPILGKFSLINMVVPGGWGWDEQKARHFLGEKGIQIFPTTPGGVGESYDSTSAIGNFELRLEVAVVAASLEDISLNVGVADASGNTNPDKYPATLTKLSDFVLSTDGKWYTVSIPLSKLVFEDRKFTTYSDLLKGNDGGNHAFRFVFQKPSAGNIQVEMAFDNIRIVNIVK